MNPPSPPLPERFNSFSARKNNRLLPKIFTKKFKDYVLLLSCALCFVFVFFFGFVLKLGEKIQINDRFTS
jgi:hypothetical protein